MRREIGFYIGDERSERLMTATAIIDRMRVDRISLFCYQGLLSSPLHSRCRLHSLPTIIPSSPSSNPDLPAEHVELIDRWISESNPSLLVVDGHPGMVLHAKRKGITSVMIRRHGLRNDSYHHEAHRTADSLIAPFSPLLEWKETPNWIRERTTYFNGLLNVGRIFSPLTPTEKGILEQMQNGRAQGKRFVVIIPRSQDSLLFESLAAVVENPDWEWIYLGSTLEKEIDRPANFFFLSDVSNRHPFLRHSTVVVAAPEDMILSEVAVADARLLCIPDENSDAEEQEKGALLEELGFATVAPSIPKPSEWSEWLNRAADSPVTLHLLIENEGARKAARYIEEMIEGVVRL